jgi:hypothetical protein
MRLNIASCSIWPFVTALSGSGINRLNLDPDISEIDLDGNKTH